MAKHILLIDDEELVIKSVRKLLDKAGYEVTVCKNGQHALNEIKDRKFDLIVCDIRMPDLNGVETIKMIRGHYKKQNLKTPPEIIISGYADESTNREVESLKVADYLYKPFDLHDFLNCVKKYIGD